MITLHQLNSFCQIVREGSFRAASERLYISQPSISQHIANLERHFGVKLFLRRGRKIQLTPEGRYLYASSTDILERINSMTERFQDMRDLRSGKLSIGCSSFTGTQVLPRTLEVFRRHFPMIDLSITSGTPEKIMNCLKNDEVEMAILGKDLNSFDREPFVYQAIGRDRLVFAAAPSIARGKTLKDCEKCTLISFFDDNPLSIYFKDLKMRNKISFRETITVEDMDIAKKFACQGLGICFLSSLSIQEELEKKKLMVISTGEENPLLWEIRAIYNKIRGLSYAGWEMMKIMQEETPRFCETRSVQDFQ